MRTDDITYERIPMFVESPRGDDKIGTDADTGSLISDHEASEKGVPFVVGVPKEKIQEAIEKQLKKMISGLSLRGRMEARTC